MRGTSNFSLSEIIEKISEHLRGSREGDSPPDSEHCHKAVLASVSEVELIYQYYHNARKRADFDLVKEKLNYWVSHLRNTSILNTSLSRYVFVYNHACPFLSEGKCSLGDARPSSCHGADADQQRELQLALENMDMSSSDRGAFLPLLAVRFGLRNEFHPELLAKSIEPVQNDMHDLKPRTKRVYRSGHQKYLLMKRKNRNILD